MKPYLFKLSRLVVAMAVSFAFTGCTITHTIKSTDLPQLQTGSPLKGVRPKIFAFKEFRDARGTDAFWVGQLFVHEQKLDQPVAVVVAMAIRKELERNGHTCVDYTQQIKADFIIDGTVYKYRLWLKDSGFTSTPVKSNVAVKLTVSPVFDDKRVFTKSYEGEYVSSGNFKEILSQAQLAMVKEMSTDSELIDFLEK